jgi:hypothetical protein
VQAFLGEIWGAAHFHIKRSSEGYFGSLLPTASAVEELLDRVKPAASAVRLVRGGETKDPATYRLPGGSGPRWCPQRLCRPLRHRPQRDRAVRAHDRVAIACHEVELNFPTRVGVGITPNAALAGAAGLHVDNGVVVDEHLATSDPDVVAAGDVANAYYPHLRTHLRLEHWSAALNQPAVAAATMLGRDAAYDRVPYFFSDQYEMGMEYSGYVARGNYDEVVFRGDVAKGEYVAFWLHDGQVLAGMNVNVWDLTDTIAALARSGQPIDRAKLVDPDVPLDQVAGRPASGAR